MGYIMTELELWVKVENGNIVGEPNLLPVTLQDLKEDKTALLALGWYPVVQIKPESMWHQFELWNPFEYKIKEDHVIWTLTKREKTIEEINTEILQNAKGHLEDLKRYKVYQIDYTISKTTDQTKISQLLNYKQQIEKTQIDISFTSIIWPTNSI